MCVQKCLFVQMRGTDSSIYKFRRKKERFQSFNFSTFSTNTKHGFDFVRLQVTI